MKVILIACLSLLYNILSFASPYNDSLINELNRSIKDAHIYDNIKLTKIIKLKNLLNEQSSFNIDKRYNIIIQLYDEYKYYNYDSALVYAKDLQRLANSKNTSSLIIDAKLKVVFVLLSSGMFKETFDSLNPISVKGFPDFVKAEYYSLMGRSYYNLADFNNDAISTPFYNHRANLYLDSAIGLYPSNSFDNIYYSAIRFLKKNNTDSALYNLNKLIDRKDLSWHEIALATSTKGGIFLRQGREDEAKPYLIQASVADIKSSTKETLALLRLAGIIYKEGKIDEAVLYIEKANADATFYNARLRKVQIGAILPLIEGEMITTITNQKEKLRDLLIVLSVLALLLAAFAIIIRNQVKKLKIARESLFEANVKQQQINQELLAVNELKEKYNNRLSEINNQLREANETKEKYNVQLQEINNQLSEANKIKEEYIGNYFNWETEFLKRIERIIASIDKKLMERRWEEMKFILKSVNLKKEKDELLKNFDKVFLKLFPNFVSQFNSLLREDDKIILKEGQLLNTELRIFALMRLGITENEKIAEILDYSINTIYAIKTKLRSRTYINKEDFKRKIFEITTLKSH